MLCTGDSRVDFDADFRIGSKREFLRGEPEQIFHLRGRQVGGRSAAPMELHHRTRTGNLLADVFNLAFQCGEIWWSHAVVFGNDHVAGAKQAKAFAKGQVHVNRNRVARRVGLFVGALQVVYPEFVASDRRGRVPGIERSGSVSKYEKYGRKANSV